LHGFRALSKFLFSFVANLAREKSSRSLFRESAGRSQDVANAAANSDDRVGSLEADHTPGGLIKTASAPA
jgi:hypothetical protein